MRHPTILFLAGLVIAVASWAALASFAPMHVPAAAGRPSWLLAGPGAYRGMHMWNAGPYVLGSTGGAPAISDVQRALNQWLALEANPRLKLGPVTEKGADAFQADIVTKDGSLVQRFDIDRRSGQISVVED